MNISNYYRSAFGIYQHQNVTNSSAWDGNRKNMGVDDAGAPAAEEASQNQQTSLTENKIEDADNQESAGSQTDPVLHLYQEICNRFLDVSFRLDDHEEALKYQAVNGVNCCPYLGYQNSMNQVGEFFGEKEQKSVELDVSVIKKAMEDSDYQEELLQKLEAETGDYEKWTGKAYEQGLPHLCISIEDEGNGIEVRGNYSKYAFSTEDQLKTMWTEQTLVENMMNQSEKMKHLLFGDDAF